MEEPEGIILVGSRPPLKWPTPNLLGLIVGMDGDGLSEGVGSRFASQTLSARKQLLSIW